MPSGNLKDYLGIGTLSGRPASLDLAVGTVGIYVATDVPESIFLWTGASWIDFSGGGGIAEVNWGDIGGTIADQTDLTSRINALINTALTSVNQAIADNASDISTQGGQISTMQTTVGTQGTAIGQLETDLTDLETEVGNKLSDAPSDGNDYVRKNGAWAVAPTGGGGGGGGGRNTNFNGFQAYMSKEITSPGGPTFQEVFTPIPVKDYGGWFLDEPLILGPGMEFANQIIVPAGVTLMRIKLSVGGYVSATDLRRPQIAVGVLCFPSYAGGLAKQVPPRTESTDAYGQLYFDEVDLGIVVATPGDNILISFASQEVMDQATCYINIEALAGAALGS